MRKLRYFLWLCLLGAGYAQIEAPGAGQGAGGSCNLPSGTTQCTAPTPASIITRVGDILIAQLTSNNIGTNPSVTGCNLNWPAPIRTAASIVQVIWISSPATTAETNCGVNVTGSAGTSSFAVQLYRNVLSVGTPSVITSPIQNVSTFNSPQMTVAAPGHVIVGLLAITHNVTVLPLTMVSPAVQRRTAGTNVVPLIADITATSAGQQITVSATSGATAQYYLRAAVELTPAPSNRTALLSDAMQSVLMNTPKSMNYVLPASGLSPTWCTWFMPINSSNTYELEPEASTQVNGQTSHVKIPAWQMTRVCQDAQGHFWASPPLLAGTGISITPAPTGLTISSTGTPGVSGMTYIAGGTTRIPGTVQVDPATCTTLYTTTGSTTPSASGVEQSDVVSYSMQPLTPGWNSWRISFHAIAYDGSITWRACNSDTAAYTPAARDINWYVARASVGGAAARHRTAPKPVHKPIPKSGARPR